MTNEERKTSKQKKITAVLAVLLAAVMLVGGSTWAYLADDSDDVVNNFGTNKVEVDLTETTGSDYNIIPGTSADKNPTVTVNATVDSYVFVVVTDNTEKLVNYTIADGWQELYIDGVKVDGVYYREVSAGDTSPYPVLDGDKVYYDETIENMLDENGDLLQNITLSFKAYAIQKINGDGEDEDEDYTYFTPAEAYYYARFGKEAETVSSVADLQSAVSVDKVAVLSEDITLSSELNSTLAGLSAGAEAVIDLNDNTLTVTRTSANTVKEETGITMTNGDVVCDKVYPYNISSFVVYGALTLDDVVLSTNGCGITPYDDAQLNIINSTITSSGQFCISTNATRTDNSPTVNVINSTLTVTEDWTYWDAAILFNVPGTLNLDGCVITAPRVAVIVRGGTAAISNCVLTTTAHRYVLTSTSTGSTTGLGETVDNQYVASWGEAGAVPQATLVLGTKGSSSYQYPTTCTLTNVTLNTYETGDIFGEGVTITGGRTVYAYGSGLNTVTLTYDSDSSVGEVVYGGGTVTVNGADMAAE